MCLHSLENFRPACRGYQVVRLTRTGRCLPFIQWVPRGKKGAGIRTWYAATRGQSRAALGLGVPYPSGFHVFHRRRDAVAFGRVFSEKFAIARVVLRNPIVVGIQNGARVTVAAERKILAVERDVS